MLSESELLLKLLSFDTQNSDDLTNVRSTDCALDFVASILDEHGINSTFQEYFLGNRQTRRRNLIAHLIDDPNKICIGLQGHIDTVPFGDYKGNPLGERKDGRIYGRGAVDMKGSLAGMISAMIQFKNLTKHPSANPALIITSDEEANQFAGIKSYLSSHDNPLFVVCGEPSSFVVEDRFKGALYGMIKIKGKSGHGSRQHEGENAIIKGIPFLKKIESLYFEVQNIENDLFRSKDPYTHKSSMNPGVITAGDKVNVIPDSMKIEFEMRLVKPFGEYKQLITERLGSDIDFVFGIDPITADLSNVEIQKRISRLGTERGVGVGLSEANLMNRTGIPSIVYGVGNKSMSHTDEEYIEESDLRRYTLKLIDLMK